VEDVIQLIPRSEWPDRIKEKDQNHSWLYDKLVTDRAAAGLPTLTTDQDGLNYCWAYAAVSAAATQRVLQGEPYVKLSSESVGGPIANWRNVGGWPEDALQQLIGVGACEEALMDKPNSLSPNRWQPTWKANCVNYRATEVMDLDVPGGKTFDACATACFLDYMATVTYDWWGHAVRGFVKLGFSGRVFTCTVWNNWGTDTEFPEFSESKGTPEGGCFAIRQMIEKG
jgi:hypothetical protein